MLVCLSGNPALDRRLHVASLEAGGVHRARTVQPLPGGKAAHTAIAARNLGSKVLWVGFLGGAVGEEWALAMRRIGIGLMPVSTAANTRLNYELIEDSGRTTEILEPGEAPTKREQKRLLELCSQAFEREWKGALLAISGSLPAGVPPDFYVPIIRSAHRAGSKVFLDTSGEWLRASLAAAPDFVKVNRQEAEGILPPSQDSAWPLAAASELLKLGAKSAAVTLGKDGLVWLESPDGPRWMGRPLASYPGSGVGCGDATLAGFAHAALSGITGERALRLACACGMANFLAGIPGEIRLADAQSLQDQIDVSRL